MIIFTDINTKEKSALLMFKNLSEEQLIKRKKIFLGIAMVMLLVMIAVLFIVLRDISQGSENKMLPFIVPTILGPLAFVPIIISSLIATELKKRKDANTNN